MLTYKHEKLCVWVQKDETSGLKENTELIIQKLYSQLENLKSTKLKVRLISKWVTTTLYGLVVWSAQVLEGDIFSRAILKMLMPSGLPNVSYLLFQ